MDRRFTLFIFVAASAFVGMSLLQPLLFPPKKPQTKPPPAAQAADSEPQPPAAAENAESAPQADSQAAQDAPSVAPTPPPPSFPNRLVALGRFGADSGDKLVVTLNSRGGTIHRIELNARLPNGRLRYRDLESDAGYLGALDVVPHELGAEIRFLSPGSPADSAGLQVGDVITRLDDQPTPTPGEFAQRLRQIRPDQELAVAYVRPPQNANELRCQIRSQRRPLQVCGPKDDPLYDPQGPRPDSFAVTLRKKMPPPAGWPELLERLADVDWQYEPTQVDGSPAAQFHFDLDGPSLQTLDLPGPLRIIKRYWLPAATAADDFARNFHVHMELSIVNLADQPQSPAFEIMGPIGTNIEGWWYQNKIHGRASAVGYTAGARDIVAHSTGTGFVFWGGPEVVKNSLRTPPDLQEIFSRAETDPEKKIMRYVGVDTQYFAAMLLPAAGETFRPYSAYVHVVDSRASIRENRRGQKTTDLTFRLFSDDVPLAPRDAAGSEARFAFEIFAGPKEPKLLRHYGLDDLVTYGWFAAFSKPLVALLRFFYGIVANYGVAIVLLTILVRLVLLPISRKAQMNSMKHAKIMQHLQPELKKLQERYKDNMEKRARAQNELFARYKYNPLSPLSGCFLMFLQLPIFIGLYRGLSVDIALRGQPLIPGLDWCSNLAGPDQLLRWKDWLPFGLGDEVGMFGPYLNLLPLLTIVLFLVQTKLFSPPPTDDQQKFAHRMMTFMMIFMGVLFFKVPSGLCVYFITSSLWGIAERLLLPKPVLPDRIAELEPGGGRTPRRVEAEVVDAPLTNEAERESRRRRDRDRQRRLKENQ